MKIQILELIEGAKKAEGLSVVIDVFRAFTTECYCFDGGAKVCYPIGSMQDAFALKADHPDWVLLGERGGSKVDGCDLGNSPWDASNYNFRGKTMIHSTSAGTQGIVNATGASEIITGSLVNAKAIAEYIMERQPEVVSLVCMGNAGVAPALEDELCAEYIKSILEGNEMPDIESRAAALRDTGGSHFFDKERQEIYPEEDFWMCVKCNRFPFVIQIEKDETGFVAKRLSE